MFTHITSNTLIPKPVLKYIAVQLKLDYRLFYQYDFNGRTAKRDRDEVKEHIGVTYNVTIAAEMLKKWLVEEIIPSGNHDMDYLKTLSYSYLRKKKARLPKIESISRIIRSSLSEFERRFFTSLNKSLDEETKTVLCSIVENDDVLSLKNLKEEIGSANVNNILHETQKYRKLKNIKLPVEILNGYTLKLLDKSWAFQ